MLINSLVQLVQYVFAFSVH